ncbi:hypothetical protein NM208_g4072 [Fusarium decemcellulare]|uniref:Uncharacterized protein n=1 Tax=Fusarium decemcellulare TaxID=57161 RepID=A0ACC1SM36_9HYPO|nr:hypothetical protein NM208_g4072 [Fusarium decemcellulare]
MLAIIVIQSCEFSPNLLFRSVLNAMALPSVRYRDVPLSHVQVQGTAGHEMSQRKQLIEEQRRDRLVTPSSGSMVAARNAQFVTTTWPTSTVSATGPLYLKLAIRFALHAWLDLVLEKVDIVYAVQGASQLIVIPDDTTTNHASGRETSLATGRREADAVYAPGGNTAINHLRDGQDDRQIIQMSMHMTDEGVSSAEIQRRRILVQAVIAWLRSSTEDDMVGEDDGPDALSRHCSGTPPEFSGHHQIGDPSQLCNILIQAGRGDMTVEAESRWWRNSPSHQPGHWNACVDIVPRGLPLHDWGPPATVVTRVLATPILLGGGFDGGVWWMVSGAIEGDHGRLTTADGCYVTSVEAHGDKQ